jgi:single-strand DNA-binding protein
MIIDPVLTVIGNLTADPELSYTPGGAALACFTIACTTRSSDRSSRQRKEGEPLFLRCSLWRQAAENAAEGLSRGTRVIAHGRLQQRSYQTSDGDKRSVIELQVDEIGPSMKYAMVKIAKTDRSSMSSTSAAEQDAAAPEHFDHLE